MNSTDVTCKNIKAIVTDIDGVLTDGSVGYGCGSDDEIKFFNVRDGSGFQLARCAGLKIAALSGRVSKANRRRLTELHFDIIKEQVKNKARGIQEICDELGMAPENVMYLGDDIIDIPAAQMVGLSVAVADAADEYKRHATWTTTHAGGHGAAREAIEKLLLRQGRLQESIDSYLNGLAAQGSAQ